MNKYNFDKTTDRRNTHSYKWDTHLPENTLPMFVADMDFEVLPEIKNALLKRVNIGSFGYTFIPEEYYLAFQSWWEKRHNIHFEREWMIYSSGVIPAISSIVRRITKEGDNVLMLEPIYNTFYNSILNNKRKAVESKIIYKNGAFAIDFEDLELKMSDPHTELMIFCNPHNPIGKIWNKEEINKVANLALKHNVKILSDEIHCDIVKPGCSYNPFLLAAPQSKDILITCISAAKVFNMSGLQCACVVIPNEALRKYIDRGLNNDEVAEPNFFAIDPVIAAFKYGEEYVDELNQYIQNNKEYVYDFFERNYPKATVIKGEATYLMWVDLGEYIQSSDQFVEELVKETGLLLASGRKYGPDGEGFVRINVGTSLSNVKDGMNRIKSYFDRRNK